MNDTRIVLMHGAGLGAWIWKKVEPLLRLPSVAISFPNRDAYKADHSATLDDYCEAVTREITSRERIILVAHSIAGVVACRLADALGSRLMAFAGIGAVIPDNGGSFLSALPFMKRVITWGAISLGGTRPPDSAIMKSYCNDLTREDADMVITKFVPESMLLYSQSCERSLPSDIPKFYVKLEKDRSLEPELQQKMIRNLDADRVSSIQAGHLAMLSEPQLLAGVLNGFFDRQQPKPQSKKTLDSVYP